MNVDDHYPYDPTLTAEQRAQWRHDNPETARRLER